VLSNDISGVPRRTWPGDADSVRIALLPAAHRQTRCPAQTWAAIQPDRPEECHRAPLDATRSTRAGTSRRGRSRGSSAAELLRCGSRSHIERVARILVLPGAVRLPSLDVRFVALIAACGNGALDSACR
jgi:hypothetical protein